MEKKAGIMFGTQQFLFTTQHILSTSRIFPTIIQQGLSMGRFSKWGKVMKIGVAEIRGCDTDTDTDTDTDRVIAESDFVNEAVMLGLGGRISEASEIARSPCHEASMPVSRDWSLGKGRPA
ncbi:hypothetical protein VNO78_08383 [Psophocarpus tetragonolobus]|uniref:Uncharacterized protein n=1 Tax=Psophocarpus tetragonolobus TaxID=3891 RepID=A0AAN9T5M8_PSOTE